MWKKMSDLCGRILSWKKEQWVLVLCVGLLLFVIALPEHKNVEEHTIAAVQESEVQSREIRGIKEMEIRLEEILTTLDGAGDVKVMITQKGSSEKVVEKDADGEEEKTIYERDSRGNEIPYVSWEKAPQIQGVMILAQGGDDPVLVKKITEAVMALFGLEAHRIKVMKMQ